jgi:hypothetical protein
LVTPSETRAFLKETGFEDIVVEDTGAKYVAGYKMLIEKAEQGALPPLGDTHTDGRDRVAEDAQRRAKHRRRPHPSNTADMPQTTITRNTFVQICADPSQQRTHRSVRLSTGWPEDV